MSSDTPGSLTDDQLRLLGAAIGMAVADGVLDANEFTLISLLAEKLSLSSAAKEKLNEMLIAPPKPEAVAELAASETEKLATYAVAAQVAKADGSVSDAENAFLQRLATLLDLSDEQIAPYQ